MLIIAGTLYVSPEARDTYVASFEDMTRRARAHPGCLGFVIAADPIEAGRVNLFEHWGSEESLAAWRAMANPPEPVTEVLHGDVAKHQVSESGPPFDE